MTTSQLALYTAGLTCSITGTILWAWNDFGAWLMVSFRRLGRATWRKIRATLVRVRILRGHVYVDAGVAMGIASAGSVDAIHSLDDSAPLEQKVDFLLRQDREHQTQLQRLGRELHDEISDRIETLRRDLDARIAKEVDQLRTEGVGLRRAGVALVVVGIVLLGVYPSA